MSSVPPLLTPSVPPPAPAATVAAEVVVLQAPAQAAARLAALKLLEGLVLAQKDGAAQLKTDLGSLTVRLPLAVPDGTKLTLQIGAPPADGFPALKLASVDGKPVTAAMLAAGKTPLQAAVRPAVELPMAGGQPALLATVVKPAAGGAASPPLPAGTAFPVRLLSVAAAPLPGTSPPAAAAGPMPGTAPAAGALPPQTAQTQAAQTQAAQPAPATVPPQTAATAAAPGPATPAMTAAPSAAAPAALPPAPAALPTTTAPAPFGGPATAPALPGQIGGTVAPNSLAGQPLVQTDVGLVTLQGGPALPPGAKVLLQVTGPATAAESAASARAAPPPAAAAPWSGLSQALQTLAQSDPTAAASLTAALPQLGPRLAANMMGMVAAAQTGTVRPVYGDRAAQALDKAGRPELARRLLQDLGEAEPQPARDAGGEWRAMALPLLNGGAIEPVRLYLRRSDPDEDPSGAAGGEKGQRFVIDVSLSALGRVQIDGLMRRKMKRLDVLIRTAEPLPGDIRQAIARIFADSCGASGVTGEAGFQVTQRFVEPAPDVPYRAAEVLA